MSRTGPTGGRRSGALTLIFCLILAAATPSLAQRSRSASSTRGSGSAGRSASGSASAGRAPSGTARTASGRATYGYGRGGHRGHYYGGHRYYGYGYGYGYPYGYSSWGLGWPYYAGPWYYPRPYGVYVEAATRSPAAAQTRISPKRADVWVDGDYVGQARDYSGKWDVLWLEPGKHLIEFRRDGYQTLRVEIHARAGVTYRIDERLAQGSDLEPRELQLTGRPLEEPLPQPSPQPGASDRADYSLEPPSTVPPPPSGALRSGMLKIDAGPGDAAVYLDGEFLARADELRRLHGSLPVASGVHQIEVVRPGYRSERVEIEVEGNRGDAPVRVNITLQREQG